MTKCSREEGEPVLVAGDTWYPRGHALARQIVTCEINGGAEPTVRYRTEYGEFTTSEQNFRFWIERLLASTSGPS